MPRLRLKGNQPDSLAWLGSISPPDAAKQPHSGKKKPPAALLCDATCINIFFRALPFKRFNTCVLIDHRFTTPSGRPDSGMTLHLKKCKHIKAFYPSNFQQNSKEAIRGVKVRCATIQHTKQYNTLLQFLAGRITAQRRKEAVAHPRWLWLHFFD